jgi:peptide/nickel transport system permease protein
LLLFILRRILSGITLIAGTTVLTFFLLYLSSRDIARRILGPTATQQAVEQKAHILGLDRPIMNRFGEWVVGALHGDLGASWFSGQPVVDAVSTRLSVTLSLVIGATVVTALVAVPLGMLAAARGGWVDRGVQFLSVLGFAVPGFLVAIGLVIVFAIDLHLVKPTGYTAFNDSATGWLSSILLPVTALSVGGIAGVTPQIRGSVLSAQRQDWVRTLRSRGLSESRIMYVHVLRNAAGPGLSVLAIQFVGLLGGAVIVEQIFAIPGLGQIAVGATGLGDMPSVMGLVIVTATIVVLLNLLVDLLQGWLNPKVRRA